MSFGEPGAPFGHRREGPSGGLPLPFGAVWSAFTSQYEATATAMTGTTAVVTVPMSTVTVQSTILSTTFVTITTGLEQSSSSSSTFSPSSSTSTLSLSQTSVPIPTPLPTAASSSTRHSTLPAVVTSSDPSGLPTGTENVPPETYRPTTVTSSTASATAAASTAPLSQKHAIVGGLSGAVAGLVLIGALLFFCLHRRRRNAEDAESDSSGSQHEIIDEKGLRPAFRRKWTELTGKGTPRATPQLPPSSSPVTVDEDHHIIRMSTVHWSRPYALGQGEGYRESMPPGALRVTNPDPSRPTTPRLSSDTAGSFFGRLQHLQPSRPTTPRMVSDTAGNFLKKQRSALANVLLTANRSRASSHSNIHDLPPQIPEIVIDPALSRECIAPNAATPSFRSYPSTTSLPVVQQRPPEDPFLTPPDEKEEGESSPARMKRPSLAPLQSAAGAAGRTLSHLGSVLNPFRTKSTQAASARSSISSFWTQSSQRNTAYSDPFDLDRPSVRGSGVQGHAASDLERGRSLYEGT